MTADEYKKQYQQQQQENQNRYYIAQKQSEIENLKRSIEINNTWYDKLSQNITQIQSWLQSIRDERYQAESDAIYNGLYDEWVAKQKDKWGGQLNDFATTEVGNYITAVEGVITDIEAKKTEIENSNIAMWNQIEILNDQIYYLKNQ